MLSGVATGSIGIQIKVKPIENSATQSSEFKEFRNGDTIGQLVKLFLFLSLISSKIYRILHQILAFCAVAAIGPATRCDAAHL